MPFNQNNILLNEPVGLIDIFPTLLKLSGLDANPKHQGHSLVPPLNDVNANWDHAALTYFGPENIAVKTEYWRYISYRDGSEELYDHRVDSKEWNNLLHGANRDKYALNRSRGNGVLGKHSLPP